MKCVQGAKHSIRRFGDELHPSGSLIHWSERDPKNVRRVAFTCRGCKEKAFVWAIEASKDNWCGLCRKCFLREGNYRKAKRDVTAPSGSVVLFSQTDPTEPDKVTVVCGLCGERRKHPRASILVMLRRKGSDWTGYCQRHYYNAGEMLALMQKKVGQASGGAQQESEKKKPGPDPVITEEKVRAAFKEYAPQEKISDLLGVEPRTFRDWHSRQGLNYRQCRQRFAKPEELG
jgi:hypothetical protein